jgi:hypothetical protein
MSILSRRSIILAAPALLLPSRLHGDGLSGSITPQSGGSIGNLFDGGVSGTSGKGSATPGNAYVAENGTTFYVAEDGSTYYVQESTASPPQAAAWSYNNLLLDFNATTDAALVDVNNTKASGFKFYVNNAFPEVTAGGPAWTTASPTQAGDISFSQGAMTIATDRSGDNQGVNTVVWNGSAIVGTTFPAQCYVEVVMGFNPALAPSGSATAWPIIWMMPVGVLSGAIGTGVDYVEVDNFEALPVSAGVINPSCNLHDWNFPSQNNSSTAGVPTQANIGTVLNRYGTLLVNPSQNGGTGIRASYFNNFHNTPDINYTAAGGASPAAAPSNPAGTFNSLANGNRYALMIGAGVSWPVTIARARVWGL